MNETLNGIVLALIGFFCFSISDLMAKVMMEGEYTLYHILFYNGLFASITLMGWRRVYGGGRGIFNTEKLKLHFIRGTILALSGMGIIYGISVLPIVNVYAIMFTAPIFVCLMSTVMLRELIRYRRWSAIILGFVGVLVVLRPRFGGEALMMNWSYLAVLGATMALAFGMVMVKFIGYERNKVRLALIPNLILLPVATVLLLMHGHSIIPQVSWHWVVFLIMGAFNGTALMFVSIAYVRARPSVVAPMEYSLMLWGVLWGYLYFSTIPKSNVLIGAFIIIASGAFIVLREQYLSRHGLRQKW